MNEKFVLWEVEYKLDAYFDQFNLPHPAYMVKNEYEVTVIEERKVKGMWGGGEYKGIKAITSDGKEFTRNWNVFPDDSMSPTFYWDSLDICDAIQISNMYPCVDENGNKRIPINSLICEEHSIIFYKDDKCWKCYFKEIKESKEK